MRRSVPARVEPGLNPNQPKARMNVPATTIGTLCPGIALRPPLRIEFADARTDDHRARERDNSAHRVNDAGAGEVHCTMAKTPIDTTLRQPTATPDPVRI